MTDWNDPNEVANIIAVVDSTIWTVYGVDSGSQLYERGLVPTYEKHLIKSLTDIGMPKPLPNGETIYSILLAWGHSISVHALQREGFII